VAYGEETSESCKKMLRMAVLYEIPQLRVHFTNLTTMHIAFNNGPEVALVGSMLSGLKPGRLSATSCVGRACILGKLSDGSVSEALNLMDQINSSACTYSKLWLLLAEWLAIGLCPIAAFGGTWRDAYTVMAINTVSMLFQRFNGSSEILEELEAMIVAFIAGAGASIDVLLIRDTSRCHAVPIILSVVFNYLPGSGIISGAREVKLGNVVLGSARLIHIVLQVMLLSVGITFGWIVQGYNSLSEKEKNNIMDSVNIAHTPAASLPAWSYCSKGAYEGWEMTYAGWGSIWVFAFLVYLHVDPRDLPVTFPSIYGVWCLYGYLAETQPAMPGFVLQASLLFIGMMVAGLEEFRGGTTRVVMRICLTRLLAPGATAITMIISGLTNMQITGVSSDLVGHLLLVGVGFAVGDGIAQVLWHPAMEWKRHHALKSFSKFSCADRLADRFMVDVPGLEHSLFKEELDACRKIRKSKEHMLKEGFQGVVQKAEGALQYAEKIAKKEEEDGIAKLKQVL